MKSLSLFIGTGKCNGKCDHCAGLPLRKYAPKKDGIINADLIEKTIKKCYKKGARNLTISSSGEPTLSTLAVTKALRLIKKYEKENIKFSKINLYSNGIRIGNDKSFCDKYLNLWAKLGLTTVYITVHNINEKKNAQLYGIKKYSSLKLIISRIHNANLLMRANLVLSKNTINSFEDFKFNVKYLIKLGADYISSWLIRDSNDKIDYKLSIPNKELDKIEKWIKSNGYNKVRLLREKSRNAYNTKDKLTLFPDGILSNKWC